MRRVACVRVCSTAGMRCDLRLPARSCRAARASARERCGPRAALSAAALAAAALAAAVLATVAAADRNFERAGNNGGVSGVQPASGRVRVVPSDAAHLPVMPRDVDVGMSLWLGSRAAGARLRFNCKPPQGLRLPAVELLAYGKLAHGLTADLRLPASLTRLRL